MLRRKAIRQLILGGGSIATVIGGSFTGWKLNQLSSTPNWQLLKTHRDLLADLTETILPTTDTAGARDAGVPAFIEHILQTGIDVKSQNNFLTGLQNLHEYCRSTFGKDYPALTINEKNKTLAHFETKAQSYNDLTAKVRKFVTGKPFFATLRDLTIIGYCSSELGATQGLAYDYVPGAFNGCIPYATGQKSWATQ